jgi:uncharacterized membrane protein
MTVICNTTQPPRATSHQPRKVFARSAWRDANAARNTRELLVTSRQSADSGDRGELNSALRKNIEALRRQRQQEKRLASREETLADGITAFTGSMRFVYLHLVIYGVWIGWNITPGIPHFDPSFVILAMEASVEAIFLSTFVLISQNRAQAAADKRDDLDLHINLLAEHELTRLIEMVSAMARKLEVRTGAEQEVSEITKDVAPEVVLKEIEQQNRKD